MNPPLSFSEFQIMVDSLDHTACGCMAEIVTARLQLEDAYACGALSLRQWRSLWEQVAVVQARYALGKPDAWRHPPVAGFTQGDAGYVIDSRSTAVDFQHGSLQKAEH